MTAQRPGRLGVGIIGAGRVGAVLGNALRAVGHGVVGVSAVSEDSRERAATLLPGVPVLDVPEVVRRAELVAVCVPSAVLADVVAGLARLEAWQPGQIVLHTAGRYGTGVLEPARRLGAIPLALHPAMAFTGTSLDLARLVGCPVAVTAPAPVLPIGQALVVEIGGEPVVVAEEMRPLYDAALTHATDHLVVLVAQAAHALSAAGVDDPAHLLAPTLSATLDAALRAEHTAAAPGGRDPDAEAAARPTGAVGALAGPVRQGDAAAVAGHLRELDRLAARTGAVDVVTAYRALARAAAQRALAAGLLRPGAVQEVLDAIAADGTGPGPAGRPPGS